MQARGSASKSNSDCEITARKPAGGNESKNDSDYEITARKPGALAILKMHHKREESED